MEKYYIQIRIFGQGRIIMIMQRRFSMIFKKKTTNDALLAAIDNGCVDDVLKGGNLISDEGVASEGGFKWG